MIGSGFVGLLNQFSKGLKLMEAIRVYGFWLIRY